MRNVAFIWDNFGPMHADRCNAVQQSLGPSVEVWGIEQYGESDTYDWVPETGSGFKKITVSNSSERNITGPYRAANLVKAILKTRADNIFFCNYERSEVIISAIICRLFGKRCFIMSCSKFDDMPRSPTKELLKRILFLPYNGAISSGERPKEYMRFLGIRSDRIETEYNTLSISRIRKASGVESAPRGVPFLDRHFTIVARFVSKKNLSMALDAYSLYLRASLEHSSHIRKLHLCGSGPLENDLRAKARELGIEDFLEFRGFLQSEDVAKVLGRSLCLLLPSIEEQFGNVVIEAQAMGVPCIVSLVSGARDKLVRSGVNGFIIEPDNPQGLAWMMGIISSNLELWCSFSEQSLAMAPHNDVARFAEAVSRLITDGTKMQNTKQDRNEAAE